MMDTLSWILFGFVCICLVSFIIAVIVQEIEWNITMAEIDKQRAEQANFEANAAISISKMIYENAEWKKLSHEDRMERMIHMGRMSK